MEMLRDLLSRLLSRYDIAVYRAIFVTAAGDAAALLVVGLSYSL